MMMLDAGRSIHRQPRQSDKNCSACQQPCTAPSSHSFVCSALFGHSHTHAPLFSVHPRPIMLHMRALTRALRVATPLRMAAVRSIAPARSHALPWCCHRTAALSTSATPPSTAAAAATPAERPTTADEQTDAEAGLNQTAQSKQKAEQSNQQQQQNEAPEGEDGAKESKAPLGVS